MRLITLLEGTLARRLPLGEGIASGRAVRSLSLASEARRVAQDVERSPPQGDTRGLIRSRRECLFEPRSREHPAAARLVTFQPWSFPGSLQ